MIDEKLLFQNIKTIEVNLEPNCNSKSFKRTLNIEIGNQDYSKWNEQYQAYMNSLPAEKIIEKFLYKFINLYGINSIGIDDVSINNFIKNEIGKKITISLSNNKSIKLTSLNLDDELVVKLKNYICKNKKEYLLKKYHNKPIDNVYIIPSSFNSEIAYYDNIVEDKLKNKLLFVNYIGEEQDNALLDMENIIDEVFSGFYHKYKNQIDSYNVSENEIKISFLNNKNIIIKDMDYINKKNDFLTTVKNQLIDVKIKKLSRRGG